MIFTFSTGPFSRRSLAYDSNLGSSCDPCTHILILLRLTESLSRGVLCPASVNDCRMLARRSTAFLMGMENCESDIPVRITSDSDIIALSSAGVRSSSMEHEPMFVDMHCAHPLHLRMRDVTRNPSPEGRSVSMKRSSMSEDAHVGY